MDHEPVILIPETITYDAAKLGNVHCLAMNVSTPNLGEFTLPLKPHIAQSIAMSLLEYAQRADELARMVDAQAAMADASE